MDIQDLGAIGEFISSVVIIVTLAVLIYQVRGSKMATLQANAQERTRNQDAILGTPSESAHLCTIFAKAEEHLGDARPLSKPASMASSRMNGVS